MQCPNTNLRKVLKVAIAGALVLALGLATAAAAQDQPEPDPMASSAEAAGLLPPPPALEDGRVPIAPAIEGDAECDPDTGELVWEVAWLNPYDVAMTIVFHEYTFSGETVELDLTPLLPTNLSPGERVAIEPQRFPGDEYWNVGGRYDTFTDLSDLPWPVLRLDVAHGPCPQPGEEAAPPAEAPTVEPRFTG